MRVIHTADLHIGKQVNGFSMIQEQQFALSQILKAIVDESIDVLIIAGDVYDKINPSEESVSVFNTFLSDVSKLNITVLIISGNHDSGVKLQFGHEILKHQNIHIVGKYDGKMRRVIVNDDFGPVNFYLMPFVRPADIRPFYNDVASYHDALQYAVDKANINKSERNVFIGHQFFASGSQEMSDSERIAVGGIDNVGYTILQDFDYAALGHLHKPQKLVFDTIRYSGSIVKYSESEVNDQKSYIIIDLKEKGTVTLEKVPLQSIKQFRKIKGYLQEISEMPASDDYVFVTLYDDDVVDALNKVRETFSNVMSLGFDNKRTQAQQSLDVVDGIENIPIVDLFKEFFYTQNNQAMNEKQEEIIEHLLERIDEHASH